MAQRMRNRRHNRSGQILVIVLLGIVLLAGLIFYVVNVGEQVNRRLGMQNAADSAAISGATWMARSMNLIAMNNVAQSRMLALVPILDSFPMATAMAYGETNAWCDALERQLEKGIQSPYGQEQRFVTDCLIGLDGDLRSQDNILHVMQGLLNGLSNPIELFMGPWPDQRKNKVYVDYYNVKDLTHWRIDGQPGPPPHGQLWQAARALADMSAAVNDTSGLLSQSNAVRYGRENGARTSFILPVLPDKPGWPGVYRDFWLPIRGWPGVDTLRNTIPDGTIPDRYPPYDSEEAKLPPPVVDRRYRLGPFDRLFPWRNLKYSYRLAPGGGPSPVPQQPVYGSDSIDGQVMGSSSRTDSAVAAGPGMVPDECIGYRTYGPYTWMMRHINGYLYGGGAPGKSGPLWSTFLDRYLRTIAGYKLGYLCPWDVTDRDPKSIHYPDWKPKYDTAVPLGATQPQSINRTAFFVISISSRFNRSDPLYLSPGSFVHNYVGRLKSPVINVRGGWVDPNSQEGWRRLCDYIWLDETTTTTYEAWDSIGLTVKLDANGKPLPQPVYVMRFFVFAGIDVGQNMEVRNPANWTDISEPPGPILIDLSHGDYNMLDTGRIHTCVRRTVFTYLGVCQADNAAAVWSQRFGRPSPYDAVVCTAQAEIFNTTSWDLWTQDWKVKLTPVTNIASEKPGFVATAWLTLLKGAVDNQEAAKTEGMVRTEDVDKVREYLEKFDPALLDEMVQH